jgi:hypothetical protein
MSEPLERRFTRCAIYTRKSTDRGLDMAVSSLVAQRDVCEAYIKCQAHRNWAKCLNIMTMADTREALSKDPP